MPSAESKLKWRKVEKDEIDLKGRRRMKKNRTF
jgi:hypothetical protein